MSGSTTYFDLTNPLHTAFLPSGDEVATGLTRIALEAELDVLGFYTKRLDACGFGRHGRRDWPRVVFTDLGDGRGVFLDGYTVDPDEADPVVADLLMRTIARVIVWRLAQETHDTATTSESSAKSTSRTYREHADSPFPRHWDRDLRSIDTRIPAWGI